MFIKWKGKALILSRCSGSCFLAFLFPLWLHVLGTGTNLFLAFAGKCCISPPPTFPVIGGIYHHMNVLLAHTSIQAGSTTVWEARMEQNTVPVPNGLC